MAEFNSEYVKNLPDTYKKSENSNNYKILNTVQGTATQIKGDTEDVFNSLDIEQATGKTLDLYGEMLGQARGLTDDSKYRTLIKSRIMRNLMTGDYNSFVKSACMIFNCEPHEFHITESEEPATVDVISLPLDSLNYVGLTAEQTIELLNLLVPVGINAKSISLSGTFEFSDSETEYNEEAGFAVSHEDQSIGGYLGLLAQNDSDKPLPI